MFKLFKKNKNKDEKKKKSIVWNLKNAIMYLSDVFVILMVVTWMLYIVLSIPAAWIELFLYGSTGIFTDLKDACVLPLSVGGAIWLIRVCITHNNAQKKGTKLTPDFPNLDENGDTISTISMHANGINGEELPLNDPVPNEEEIEETETPEAI